MNDETEGDTVMYWMPIEFFVSYAQLTKREKKEGDGD